MVGQLPPRQRAVIVLRYYEDLPEAQVAEVLGCSVGPRVFTYDGVDRHTDHLAASASGAWPDITTATLSVTPGTDAMTLLFLCEGAIAASSGTVTYRIDGEETDPAGFTCDRPGPGGAAVVLPAARRSTYTPTFVISSTVPQYDTRPSSWTIGVYLDSGDG